MDTSSDERDIRHCANCGTTSTPLWRRHDGDQILCNACGLYQKTTGQPRPPRTVRHWQSVPRRKIVECANCRTKTTSMWRRDYKNDSVCNACGLYFRLNGVERPIEMRKESVKPRKRRIKKVDHSPNNNSNSAIVSPPVSVNISNNILVENHTYQAPNVISNGHPANMFDFDISVTCNNSYTANMPNDHTVPLNHDTQSMTNTWATSNETHLIQQTPHLSETLIASQHYSEPTIYSPPSIDPYRYHNYQYYSYTSPDTYRYVTSTGGQTIM